VSSLILGTESIETNNTHAQILLLSWSLNSGGSKKYLYNVDTYVLELKQEKRYTKCHSEK
jgi:hypothetical protein